MVESFTQSYFMSSYAKVFLSSWPVLAELVIKHVQPSKVHLLSDNQDQEKTSDHLPLITDQQIAAALNGPYQEFFKACFSAYSMLTQVKKAHALMGDEALKTGVLDDDLEFNKKMTRVSLPQAENLAKQLDELVLALDQELTEVLVDITAGMKEQLNQLAVKLTENELAEFGREYPLFELQERFTDLNVEMPALKPSTLDFSNYFYLKSYIAIYSGLGLEQKSNSVNDMKPYLKQLRVMLTEIRSGSKQWHENMQQQIDQLMSSVISVRDNTNE